MIWEPSRLQHLVTLGLIAQRLIPIGRVRSRQWNLSFVLGATNPLERRALRGAHGMCLTSARELLCIGLGFVHGCNSLDKCGALS